MLDNIEQNDDIHVTDLAHGGFVGRAGEHVEPGGVTMRNGILRQFDAGHVEVARGFQQKEAIGAAKLEKFAIRAEAADEVDAAGKLATQHRLGAPIVGIAVGMAAGEVVLGVVGRGVEPHGFGAADEATLRQVGYVDVIVLFDVIEHLSDPRQTLALCHQHLNPGGIIVITTGDFGSAVARLLGAKWRLMTPPQHLWFFTQDSIRWLAGGLGLAVERVDHPWKIVPVSLIAFQLQRMLGLHGAAVASASRLGVPANLFDAMRIVLRKAP